MKQAWLVAIVFLSSASNADALCIYNGELYAKTTLEQEFEDATAVLRGTVLSSREIAAPGDGGVGVVYRVRINQSFKGSAPATFSYYSERNSGGFYLDAGTEYLLFLDPLDPRDWASAITPGAFVVNYSCGQSRAWSDVPVTDQRRLNALSPQR